MKMTGESLKDRYQLIEELEKGSCLVRYLACDEASGAEVEIDIIEPDKSACPHLGVRLKEVLDRARQITGHRIAALLEWGEEGERIYLVRERFNGSSLAEILDEVGDLPREQVVEIAGAAIEAMVEAYGKGLFYLGLNPGQIVLNWRGEIRLVRVGYGWLLEEMDEILAAGVSPYRAPETDEQREGARTSDVYSLSVMIREMLPMEQCSDRLNALLDKAMSPHPKQRPSSPRLLQEALEEATSRDTKRIPVENAGHISIDDDVELVNGGGKRGSGLRFLHEDAAPPPYISLQKRPRWRSFRIILLIILGGVIVWLLFAAITGSLDANKKNHEEAVVSTGGAEKVTLPDLQGLPAREAERILLGLGLTVASRQAPSYLWSAGMVAAQEPEKGSILDPGDMVNLVISSGRDGGQGADTSLEAGSLTPASPGTSPGEVPADSSSGASELQTGDTAPVEPSYRAEPQPPQAVAALSTRSGPSPLRVAMDGRGSRDPDGSIARYVWDCGDGTVLEGVEVQHVYDPAVTPARFQIVLKVFDCDGMSDSCAVTVEVF
jgi:hypothetical protein